MKATVVYETRFGNTAKIARAIATGLEAAASVLLVEATDERALDLDRLDLLVVGGPTEGHGVNPVMRAFLHRIPEGCLRGINAAAFDTRLILPSFPAGSAATGIAIGLQDKGATLIEPSEHFLVTRSEDIHLVDGEIEHAAVWAEKLLATMVSGAAPIAPQ